MSTLPDFKRGDTFSLGCIKRDSDGAPENLTNVTIAAQVRDSGDTLLGTAVAAKANQTTSPGEFSLTVDSTVTATWDLGRCYIDVEFSVGGAVTSSETMTFKTIKDITHG